MRTGLDNASTASCENTTGGPLVLRNDYQDGKVRGKIVEAGSGIRVAEWEPETHIQMGTYLELWQGNSPGSRKTASVTISIYRGGNNAPCGCPATATTWKV